MRKLNIIAILLIISTLMSFFSCSVKSSDTTAPLNFAADTQSLFGQWQYKGTANGIKSPYEVTMEIKNERDANNLLTVSGKSSVNFYFAGLTFDATQKTMKLSPISSTKINGSAEAMKFEQDYYSFLTKVESYELTTINTMHLIMPSDATNKYLIFERIN